MNAAASSWWTSTKRTRSALRRSPSMIPLMPSPGSPKTVSTPQSARRETNTSDVIAAITGAYPMAHWLTVDPVSLTDALATFDALWSPRIVTRVNDYDVRIAKVASEHVWHTHEDTDEFFLVLEGELRIALRNPEERTVVLPT